MRCVCGHARKAHRHDRPGSDCSRCLCPRYQRRWPWTRSAWLRQDPSHPRRRHTNEAPHTTVRGPGRLAVGQRGRDGLSAPGGGGGEVVPVMSGRRSPETTSARRDGRHTGGESEPLVSVGVGRPLSGIIRTVEALTEAGVLLRSLREGIDYSTATGRMLAGIFAALAAYERELMHERAAAARDAAGARPATLAGRPGCPTPRLVRSGRCGPRGADRGPGPQLRGLPGHHLPRPADGEDCRAGVS